MRLGIDLGTTHTVVAYADRGNYPLVSFTDVAGDTVEHFPSVVAEHDGQLRYGFEAIAASADSGWTTLRSFKRLLSQPSVSPEAVVALGGTTLPLSELLAGFLRALAEALRTKSNLPRAMRRDPKIEAAVATPANAHSTQRFLTLEAFRQAGYEVLAVLNEPSAAGFEYAHRHRGTLTSTREHVVVYDLGGGTFDASLVRMSGRQHDVLATHGINLLGGDDFDVVLAELALAAAGKTLAALGADARGRLLEHCREAKETLHPNSRKIALDLGGVLPQGAEGAEVSVSVADYYDACAPLIDRTLDAMTPVLARLDRDTIPSEPPTDDVVALPSDVAGIYVVGGGSSLPAVARALRARFGRRVHRSPYPSAATAIGLAIATDDKGFDLVDRFSRTFGVFREERSGRGVSFDPIFTREMRLPQEGDEPLVSRRRYRAAHNLGHFRFVECGSLDEAGAPRGDLAPFADVLFPFDPSLREREDDLTNVPVVRRDGEGPLVEEAYEVDARGVVRVVMRDLESGFERVYRLGG